MQLLKLNKNITIILFGLFLVSCENLFIEEDAPTDAYAIFDEAWTILDQRYSLFEVKGIDWESSYTKYHSQLFEGMSKKELFIVLGDMVVSLKDGHTDLHSLDLALDRNYWHLTEEYTQRFNINSIFKNYLGNSYILENAVLAGKIGNVGYTYIGNFREELSPSFAAEILDFLAGVDNFIFDVRNNTGGNEKYGSNIIGHFITEKIPSKIVVNKTGPGKNDKSSNLYYLAPVENFQPYNKIVVLANRATFSAGNDFVNNFSLLPNVTIIGDTTGGGGATPYYYELANGWRLRYSSNLQYRAFDSLLLENGIPPDIYIEMQKSDTRDVVLDRALLHLAK